MIGTEFLQGLRERLRVAYGRRFQGLVLCGSEARGEAAPDSDVDVLVLLDGPACTWGDYRAASEAVYPLMLELGRPIDAIPVDLASYEKGQAPLYQNAQREGVRL